mmetsp:Transcript_14509/g.50510  ORF Transcript_14509/g.50510 Transcript_14509/m.50510 type:complete len:429 (-) Transcript_14509:117-1403(-)|eukprot:CAMPEP_0203817416 /NCGR_PEP_ID=MMETSP0115-20131106/25368_1 /ASSEMBLY_ACC=CAM_ASM_000227 /TAXON_ID=33651 /ORGANISM="Bicosoecid sp, Strain ms1" /LENGTH=428 /DNA_ID=CAMNT_0050726345 /DNA_START=26 /DNA_END=1312 /DNA_ORIENTATION=-
MARGALLAVGLAAAVMAVVVETTVAASAAASGAAPRAPAGAERLLAHYDACEAAGDACDGTDAACYAAAAACLSTFDAADAPAAARRLHASHFDSERLTAEGEGPSDAQAVATAYTGMCQLTMALDRATEEEAHATCADFEPRLLASLLAAANDVDADDAATTTPGVRRAAQLLRRRLRAFEDITCTNEQILHKGGEVPGPEQRPPFTNWNAYFAEVPVFGVHAMFDEGTENAQADTTLQTDLYDMYGYMSNVCIVLLKPVDGSLGHVAVAFAGAFDEVADTDGYGVAAAAVYWYNPATGASYHDTPMVVYANYAGAPPMSGLYQDIPDGMVAIVIFQTLLMGSGPAAQVSELHATWTATITIGDPQEGPECVPPPADGIPGAFYVPTVGFVRACDGECEAVMNVDGVDYEALDGERHLRTRCEAASD